MQAFTGILLSLLVLSLTAASAAVAAPFAFVSNRSSGTVSIIDAGAGAACLSGPPPCVVQTLNVGLLPAGVAVNREGTRAYVANQGSDTVSVIDVRSKRVVDSISVGADTQPWGVAVSATDGKVYVTLNGGVAVIDVNNVNNPNQLTTIPIGGVLNGIAVVGSRAFVSDGNNNNIVMIDGTSVLTFSLGNNSLPFGVVADPDRQRVYVVHRAELPGDRLDLVVSAFNTNNLTRDGVTVIESDTAAFPQGVAVSPDGALLYVVKDTPNEEGLIVATIATGDITPAVSVGAGPVGVATNFPAGTHVFVGSLADRNVSVIGATVGACAGGTPPCAVKRVPVESMTFVFGAFATDGPPVPQYALTLTSAPVVGGMISAQPPGGTYEQGTVVTLTANPAIGYQFSGWSGCSGSGNTCSVTMDMAKSVTATFTLKQYGLTVTAAPAAGGTITPPGGTYDHGTVVTLTANPATGYQFSGWSGCSGSGNTCSVTMDMAKSVTANFTVTTPPPTTCDDKIKDLQKKVAADKHPWRHDHQLKAALRLYSAAQVELGKAKAKVGDSDKRYVRALKEFNSGKAALCAGHYWRAHHELWESYYLAHEILKHHQR